MSFSDSKSKERVEALKEYAKEKEHFSKECSLFQRVRGYIPPEDQRNEGEIVLYALALARYKKATRRYSEAQSKFRIAIREITPLPSQEHIAKVVAEVRGFMPVDSSSKVQRDILQNGRVYEELPDQDKFKEQLQKIIKEREEVKIEVLNGLKSELGLESEPESEPESNLRLTEPEQEVSILDIPMNLTDTLEDFDTLEE